MNCNIIATPDFARELKQLAKRYPSMKDDYKSFLDELAKTPLMGDKLGKHLHKVRFPIASKGKGFDPRPQHPKRQPPRPSPKWSWSMVMVNKS